jgi:hypothetical protein
VFFLKVSPSRRRNSHTALCETFTPRAAKFVLQAVQGQVRRLRDPFNDEGLVRFKRRLAISAHLGGRDRSCRTMALRPFHRRRDCNAEPLRRRPATLATGDCGHDTLTKIIGERSNHAMLASIPASILNHRRHKMGIHTIQKNREPL